MSTIAFVGCGHIHIPGFIRMIKGRSDVKVKSVWDHNPDRAKPRAAEVEAAVVADPQEIWNDEEIQAVIIASETDRHEELVKAAAKAKKHLFVEKPLGMGSRDAYAMAKAITKAGVMFQTGYFMRGLPVCQFMREQIQKGTFGKITRIRGSNCHAGALKGWFDSKPNDVASDWRWMANPEISGCGAFGDLGTHSLDILIWLMGEVEAVAAHVDNGTGRYPNCDETGESLIRFASGTIGTLAAAWDDLANPASLIISGTEAHAAVINGKLYLTCPKIEGADGKEPWSQLPEELPHAFELFLNAVGGRSDVPLVSAQEAAYRSAVMEAMYKAAKGGRWVRPKAPPEE